MTFFEWIRKCLQWDAKQHPLPKEKSASIRKDMRQTKRAAGGDAADVREKTQS